MTTSTSAPSWWAQWGSLVTMYAQEFGVPVNLAAGVIQQESGGDPNAQSTFTYPNGTVGHANGLMQIVNGPFDVTQNISQGMQQLGADLQMFGTTLGLAAYNAGVGNVQKYGMNILNPTYLLSQGWTVKTGAFEPAAYVNAVTGFANAYANVLGPTLPTIPAQPKSPTPALPGTASGQPSPSPTVTTANPNTPSLSPIPPPAATGFWPVDAFNSASNTVANGILSIERFFFIGIGLALIALGLWLLVKAEDKNGSVPTS